MLTRIEIDGFKNLLGFSAEFGPFTCIAGPNAVGKSNLFDAIEFMSLLSQYKLDEAAGRVRATPGAHESARALFWNDGEVWADRLKIAVELLIDEKVVVDDLGRPAWLAQPSYRYEVEVGFDGGLRLVGERLSRVSSNLRFPSHSSFVRAHQLDQAGEAEVIFDVGAGVMPDGSKAPDLSRTARTVLQLYQTADHPELLAVRSELVSWRRFALNPVELRKPHKIGSADQISESGEHLPLLFMQLLRPGYPTFEIEGEDDVLDCTALSASIVARLGRLAGLRGVTLEEDREREVLSISAVSRSGETLSARSLSEGTLRALALVLLSQQRSSMLCVEEAENGIHPDQFDDIVRILFDLATDPTADVSAELAELHGPEDFLPLRQAIITTHSPDLLRRIFATRKDCLLMAMSVLLAGPHGRRAQTMRALPLRDTWRCRDGVRGVMLPMLAYVGYEALNAESVASAAEDG